MRLYNDESETLTDSPGSAVILFDCDGNRVLFQDNERVIRPVASLTKLATALAVLECVDDPTSTSIEVTQSSIDEVDRLEGKLAGFENWVGSRFSVMDYLYGLLIESGCEAGFLLADYVSGGNRPAFIERLNALARGAGCRDTRFCDPCGLLDESQSTAYDVLLLFRRVLEHPTLRRITSTTRWVLPHFSWPIVQTNELKRFDLPHFFPYAVCGKTGTTEMAGRCLACSFERNGKTYIAVALGGELDDPARFFQKFAALVCGAFAREGPFMRITVDHHELNASAGDRFRLHPRCVYNNTGEAPRFRFESLNPDIAGVDAHGLVTVRRTGVCQIEIAVQTGDYDLVCVNTCGSDLVCIERCASGCPREASQLTFR